MIVKCKCGQDNRIPDVTTPGSTYRCGNCEKELHFIVTATATPLINAVPGTPYPVAPVTVNENVSKAPAIVSAVLLLLAAVGRWPYGFYTLLRFAACGSAVYLAVQGNELKKFAWVWIMGFMAVLFNPLVPIRLPRSSWQAIDLVAAIVFAVSISILRKRS